VLFVSSRKKFNQKRIFSKNKFFSTYTGQDIACLQEENDFFSVFFMLQ